MSTKKLLIQCDSYKKAFEGQEIIDHTLYCEYADFVKTHLPKSASNLRYDVDYLTQSNNDPIKHIESVKNLLRANDSALSTNKENIISNHSNYLLLAEIIGIIIFIFTIGFYFGTEKINKDNVNLDLELKSLRKKYPYLTEELETVKKIKLGKIQDEKIRFDKVDNSENSQGQIVSKFEELSSLSNIIHLMQSPDLTDLQKQRLEKQFKDQIIIWDLYVISVPRKSIINKSFNLMLSGSLDENDISNMKFLTAEFDSKYEESLALLKVGDRIKIKGKIESLLFFPNLYECNIVSRLPHKVTL